MVTELRISAAMTELTGGRSYRSELRVLIGEIGFITIVGGRKVMKMAQTSAMSWAWAQAVGK